MGSFKMIPHTWGLPCSGFSGGGGGRSSSGSGRSSGGGSSSSSSSCTIVYYNILLLLHGWVMFLAVVLRWMPKDEGFPVVLRLCLCPDGDSPNTGRLVEAGGKWSPLDTYVIYGWTVSAGCFWLLIVVCLLACWLLFIVICNIRIYMS